MNIEELQNLDDEAPPFPYHVIWPGYGNTQVTIRELGANEDEYLVLGELAAHPHYDAPRITRAEVEGLLSTHGLDGKLARDAWLIGSYYLTPKQQLAFGLDPKRSKAVLKRAHRAARLLDQAMSELPPKVLGALHYMRGQSIEDTMADPPVFLDMHRHIQEFQDVVRKAADDLDAPEGRPRSHRRDTMIRLFIEFLKDAGHDDLVVSNGTKSHPEPHLKGQAGRLLSDLIGLLEPSWQESWVAPKVKAVRSQMRKAEKAGAKTHQT